MIHKKLHPYMFVSYIKIIPYIFLIPIFLQSVLKNISIGLLMLLYTLCILIASLTIFIQFYRYINTEISIIKNKILINNGILTKSTTIVYPKNICSISVEQNLLNKCISSCRVFITPFRKNPILKNGLYLTTNQASNIKNAFLKNQIFYPLYKISLLDLILLPFSNFNVIYVIFVFITTLRKIQLFVQNNLNKKYKDVFTNKFNFVGLNSIFSSLLYLFILFLIFSLISKIIKFCNLKIYSSKYTLYIKHGLLHSYSYFVNLHEIYALSYKSTILSIIFPIRLVYIHTIKSKGIQGQLLIATIKPGQNVGLNIFIKNDLLNKKIIEMSPNRKAILSYLFYTLLLILILFILINLTLLKSSKILILPILFLFMVYYIIVKIYALRKSKVILYKNTLNIKSCKGLSLYNTFIPIDNIHKVKIMQSPFQILSKRCNFYIYSLSNAEKPFKVQHLNINNVEKFVETLENS